MAEIPQIIMDIREEVMISPKGGKPISKPSHFIKPMLQFPDKTPFLPSNSLPFRPASLECNVNGWRSETDDQWVAWVNKLAPKFTPLWKKAGIFEAIVSSRFLVVKNEELFLGLVERWCSETNTFVFPWGEATLTLEDVMVLGGFSVLGASVYEFDNDKQVDEVEEKLLYVYDKLKCAISSSQEKEEVYQERWMERFMKTKSKIEHEAFLCLWLSRFVFPSYPFDSVVTKCFRLAVCLANGIEIALAPFVLASIYKDLSLIKSTMKEYSEIGVGVDDLLVVCVWAPLQLVQVWAWERFPMFRPQPKKIGIEEPRVSRWHGVNAEDIGNVRAVLQSCGDSFVWRPYCEAIDGLANPSGVYREDERWVFMNEDVGKDVQVLACCLRVGELVGLESIEQYNPHRVAMQFGFDQDLPVVVKRDLIGFGIPHRELQQLVWIGYCNPIKDQMLYIPSMSYTPLVSLRYLEWLREGALTRRAALNGILKRKRGLIRWRRLQPPRLLFAIDQADSSNLSGDGDGNDLAVHSGWDPPSLSPSPRSIFDDPDVRPGFTPIPSHSRVDGFHGFGLKKPAVCATDGTPGPPGFVSNTTGTAALDVAKSKADVPPIFLPKSVGNQLGVPPGFSPISVVSNRDADVPSGLVPKSLGNHLDVLPGFSPKSVVSKRDADVARGFVLKSVGNDLDVPPGFSPKSVVSTKKSDVLPGFVPKSVSVGNHVHVTPGFRPIRVTPKKIANASKEGSVSEPLVKVKEECIESIGDSHHTACNVHDAGNVPGPSEITQAPKRRTTIAEVKAQISLLEKMIAELKEDD